MLNALSQTSKERLYAWTEAVLCSPGAIDIVKVEEAHDGWAGDLGNLSSIVIAAAN